MQALARGPPGAVGMLQMVAASPGAVHAELRGCAAAPAAAPGLRTASPACLLACLQWTAAVIVRLPLRLGAAARLAAALGCTAQPALGCSSRSCTAHLRPPPVAGYHPAGTVVMAPTAYFYPMPASSIGIAQLPTAAYPMAAYGIPVTAQQAPAAGGHAGMPQQHWHAPPPGASSQQWLQAAGAAPGQQQAPYVAHGLWYGQPGGSTQCTPERQRRSQPAPGSYSPRHSSQQQRLLQPGDAQPRQTSPVCAHRSAVVGNGAGSSVSRGRRRCFVVVVGASGRGQQRQRRKERAEHPQPSQRHGASGPGGALGKRRLPPCGRPSGEQQRRKHAACSAASGPRGRGCERGCS